MGWHCYALGLECLRYVLYACISEGAPAGTAVDTTGVACKFCEHMAFIVLLMDTMKLETIQLPFLSEPILHRCRCVQVHSS